MDHFLEKHYFPEFYYFRQLYDKNLDAPTISKEEAEMQEIEKAWESVDFLDFDEFERGPSPSCASPTTETHISISSEETTLFVDNSSLGGPKHSLNPAEQVKNEPISFKKTTTNLPPPSFVKKPTSFHLALSENIAPYVKTRAFPKKVTSPYSRTCSPGNLEKRRLSSSSKNTSEGTSELKNRTPSRERASFNSYSNRVVTRRPSTSTSRDSYSRDFYSRGQDFVKELFRRCNKLLYNINIPELPGFPEPLKNFLWDMSEDYPFVCDNYDIKYKLTGLIYRVIKQDALLTTDWETFEVPSFVRDFESDYQVESGKRYGFTRSYNERKSSSPYSDRMRATRRNDRSLSPR